MTDKGKKTKEKINSDKKIIEIPKEKRPIPVSSDDALRKAGIPESEIR